MDVKPGYKQTEIGPIPEDWDDISLDDLFDFKNGLNKGKDYFGYGTPIVNYMDVYNHAGLRAGNVLGRVTVSTQELDAYSANRGDVFFTRTSETAEEVGIASVLLEDMPNTVFSGFVLRARPKNSVLSDNFKKYCFSSEIVRNQIVAKSTYTTRALTNGRTLSSVVLPLPTDKQEQEAIAETLSDVDELIESLVQLIAKKRLIKHGAMHELLSGKKRLPGLDGKWESKPFGEIATVAKSVVDPRTLNQSIPCVELEHLDQGSGLLLGYTDPTLQASLKIRFSKNDVLFGKLRPYLRKFLFADFDGVCSSEIWVLRPLNSSIARFVYYLVQSEPFINVVNQTTGTKMPRAEWTTVKSTEFNIPPTSEEQEAIADLLANMDSEMESLETKLAKIRNVKQGIMQELLNGRIRLVQPGSNVVPFLAKEKAAGTANKGHNSAINEAVIISVLAKHFGSDQYPLGRKRYTKLSYLLHRHSEGNVKGYLEKAAGPYNPSTKYKGAEKIALSNRYVRAHARDNFSGFIPAEKIAEAEDYFSKWYGDDVIEWLEQFRYKKNDELELLATVDFAIINLGKLAKQVNRATVKQYIHDTPEWTAKLSRSVFSDENIGMAIEWSRQLFESVPETGK